MAKFNVGDRVLVNDGLVATITSYDEDNNLLSYESKVGGATNTFTSHISNTKVVPLSEQTVEELEPEVHETSDAVVNVGPNDESPASVEGDQINTLDNQQ